jgi:uncharacterized protein
MQPPPMTTFDAAPRVDEDRARAKKKAQARAALLRQTLRWHWISAAVCLIGMLLFAATGVTLNHADVIKAEPARTEKTATAPAPVLAQLQQAREEGGALPLPARRWVREAFGARISSTDAVEWSPEEAYVSLASPGADAWVSLDLASGEAVYERTERGPVALLNDLHKGRNAGPAWKAFIDIFAIGCVVFCVTGLILLQLHAQARKSTWPLVGLGLLIPLLLVLFLVH